MASSLRLRQTLTRDDENLTGPRPGTIAAGVVAVVILISAGAIALSGGTGTSAPAPVSPAAGVPGSAVTVPVVQPSSSAAQAEEGPLLVAPTVNWKLLSGVPLPYSRTAGPLRVNGPVCSGFQRSQTGALLAAEQIGTRYLITPGDGWREVLDRQVLPGPGRDIFARVRATLGSDDPPGTYGQPAGFRFVAFTPDVASIQLVTRFPTTGHLQVATLTVQWVDGDWRLLLQPDGSSSPTAQAVKDLSGFVVWGI